MDVVSEKNQRDAKKFYDEYQHRIYFQTDKIFLGLFLVQWLAAIIVTLVISPKTWIGTYNQIHLHVWAALILQGLIISLPLYLIHSKPGHSITRHTIAIAQMLTSALLIHLTGGRIETHFHVFGSLALLASYRDYPVIISATVVVALDHFFRGVFWPESVFGVLTASPYRWIEHAWWVAFEDVFLIRAILISQREMKEIAYNNARLVSTNDYITQQVEEKSEALKQKNLELLQAQKMESIGQLAAGIAHEINTPTQYIGDNTRFLKNSLGKILKMTERAKHCVSEWKQDPQQTAPLLELDQVFAGVDMDYLAKEIPAAIEQSLEGVSRVAQIVGAMKEFSHPGGEEKTPVDLNHAIETTITVARNEWKYVAAMETDFDPQLPLVSCMRGEMNQVFLNLIVNAAHAIQEKNQGGGMGAICFKTRSNENTVEIKISDTGNGIPEQVQNRIFEPFFTTKTIGKGSGQGLAITRSVIVDKHGGAISFETEAGRGTSFTIQLPL